MQQPYTLRSHIYVFVLFASTLMASCAFLLFPIVIHAQSFVPLVQDLPLVDPVAYNSANLGGLLNGVMGILLGIAVLLAVIMFAVGGFRYLISEAVPSKGAAKSQMLSAVLGLLLVLTSILILNTINPKLIDLDIFGGADKVDGGTGTTTSAPPSTPPPSTPPGPSAPSGPSVPSGPPPTP